MVLDLLQNPSFFSALLKLDQELAAAMHLQPCSCCGGPLHFATYARKPRGLPSGLDRDLFGIRLSFCCGHCRKRHTPSSLLFIRHKVYPSPVITLACMLLQGVTEFRLKAIEALGIPRQTIYRWIQWWETEFRQSSICQSLHGSQGRLDQLPQDGVNSLLGATLQDKLILWLKNIKEFSVTCSNWARIVALAQRL